ncbi:MAG: magnesium chelatase subunit D [Pseudomonadota bacterium]
MSGAAWKRALRALSALCVDPGGLKGLTVRARPSPARQVLEDQFAWMPLPLRRIHPDLTDTQLFGGVNVAASLTEGRMVRDPGIAENPGALVLTMAERASSGLAARLGLLLDNAHDQTHEHALILLDEGADPEEGAHRTLTERLAFHVDLSDVRWSDAKPLMPAPGDLDAARARLADLRLTADQQETLITLAMAFGIDSLRAPQLAARAARSLAALDGEDMVTDDHLQEAAELVYPVRATRVPEVEAPDAVPDQAEAQQDDQGEAGEQTLTDIPQDMIIEAVRAMLPADFLTRLESRARAKRAATGSGAGLKRVANRRGRPLPPRPRRLDGRARIDVVATLRTAAPWQMLRRQGRPDAPRLIIHPSDIRLKRYEERSDRLVIFAVDASGSAAMARMNEAKGAVELMLAQAYAKRDQVALIGFRGEGAEILLSPTRSLVQAKKQLSGLPGGGGTPLASGLQAALQMAELGRVRGSSPALAILTDGRANVGLHGVKGRAQAREDAQAMSHAVAGQGLKSVVIDTANRPGREGAELAGWLNGDYLPLPRADARMISAATDAALTA